MDDEAGVRQATLAFYEALEAILAGRGLGPMREMWHPGDEVSAAHPMGAWARGQDEMWRSWEALATIASVWKMEGHLDDLRVYLHGDVAYATGIFESVVSLEHRRLEMKLNCTNVLRREGSAWKMVHHHADAASELATALTEAAEQAHR